jgi:hypothetical protein
VTGSGEGDGVAVVPLAGARVRLELRALPSREIAVVLWSPRLHVFSEPEPMARPAVVRGRAEPR